jgi:aldose 1-epimerase
VSDFVRLESGPTSVEITPSGGGCVAAYATEARGRRLNWFRQAPAEALAARDPLGMGCFPLVPFSNRIRDGRFQAGRRAVSLRPNAPGQPHVIHGHGWQRPWLVEEQGAVSLRLLYQHAPDSWPFAYEAWQRFALDGPRLTIEIGLRNTGDEPMPAGIGLHPYFERTDGLRLTAPVAGVWHADAEVLPTEHAAPPPRHMDLGESPRVDDLVLDHCFTGWSRRAVLDWPERGAQLTIEAEPPLDFVIVYAPKDRSCLCVEPVSHMIDAFNRAAAGHPHTGTRTLAPGQSLSATVAFTPKF